MWKRREMKAKKTNIEEKKKNKCKKEGIELNVKKFNKRKRRVQR